MHAQSAGHHRQCRNKGGQAAAVRFLQGGGVPGCKHLTYGKLKQSFLHKMQPVHLHACVPVMDDLILLSCSQKSHCLAQKGTNAGGGHQCRHISAREQYEHADGDDDDDEDEDGDNDDARHGRPPYATGPPPHYGTSEANRSDSEVECAVPRVTWELGTKPAQKQASSALVGQHAATGLHILRLLSSALAGRHTISSGALDAGSGAASSNATHAAGSVALHPTCATSIEALHLTCVGLVNSV
eukprot:1155620-Pelagomonas_calceolata.AAC.14